jgi:integrase
MPFDARAAKLLQAGQHLLILPEHPGLRLERSATKWAWIYRYKSPVDDGMRQFKIGGWPKVQYHEAAKEWEKLRAERDAGRDPQLEKKAARRKAEAADEAERAGPFLVKHLVEDYLSGHIDKHRKPKGRAEVRRVLERHSAPIADKPAEHVLRKDAYDLIDGLKNTPVIAGQVRQELGAAWDYGLDSGRLTENTPNWWRQIMRGKLRSKGKKIDGEHVGTQKRVLTEQEIGQLLNWMPNMSKLVQDALTMYLWTGTRGAEIMPMQAREITEEADGWWWTIPKGKTKNARHENATDLRVPLIGRAKTVVLRRLQLAQAVLREDPDSPGYLFSAPSKLGYTEQKTIQASVYTHQPYAKRAPGKNPPILPVTHWGPHDLRRTVRTRLAAMGCPNDVAEAVIGHMQKGIVAIYNLHQYDPERRDWLTRLDARLEQLAQQSQSARAAS